MIYVYRCISCYNVIEKYKKLSEFTREEICPYCGGIMALVPQVPNINTGIKKFKTIQKEKEALVKDEMRRKQERELRWKEFLKNIH